MAGTEIRGDTASNRMTSVATGPD